ASEPPAKATIATATRALPTTASAAQPRTRLSILFGSDIVEELLLLWNFQQRLRCRTAHRVLGSAHSHSSLPADATGGQPLVVVVHERLARSPATQRWGYLQFRETR